VTDDTRTLDAAEQARLDAILEMARKVHYLNLLVAALALLLLAPGTESISLPLLQVPLARANAIVPLFLLSILLTAASDRLATQAYRWLPLDPRRVPFPWHPLGASRTNYWTLTTWVYLPVIVTGIAASITLWREAIGLGLLIPGFLLAGSQRVRDRYGLLVRDRADHRGGPATLSMWLLYLYRMVRNDLMAVVCAASVVGSMPSARAGALKLIGVIVGLLLGLLVCRAMAGALFYRRIDRIGPRWGFPSRNAHDY
jgi:hypothetical protein